MIKAAINDVRVAEMIYNEVDPEYEEAAWHKLQEARARLSALIREAKRERIHNAG